MSDEAKTGDPWDRDQKGVIGDGFVEVDGVTLPGVFDRGISVEYAEKPDAKWPIRLTINFYLDELEISPDLAKYVDFSMSLSGPKVEEVEDDEAVKP